MADIFVYVYDLTNGLARQISPALLGKTLEGIWHTSVVIQSEEIFFGGGGIERSRPPGITLAGVPTQKINMGKTEKSQQEIEEKLLKMNVDFHPSRYDLLRHNCNNFTDQFVYFLTGRRIPGHILSLPEEIMSTPFGQQIMPLLQSFGQGQRIPSFPNFSRLGNQSGEFSNHNGENFRKNNNPSNTTKFPLHGQNSSTIDQKQSLQSLKTEDFILSVKKDPHIGLYIKTIIKSKELYFNQREIAIIQSLEKEINSSLNSKGKDASKIVEKEFFKKHRPFLIGFFRRCLVQPKRFKNTVIFSTIAVTRFLVLCDAEISSAFAQVDVVGCLVKDLSETSQKSTKIVLISLICNLFNANRPKQVFALATSPAVLELLSETAYCDDSDLLRHSASCLAQNVASGMNDFAPEEAITQVLVLLNDRLDQDTDATIKDRMKKSLKNLLRNSPKAKSIYKCLGLEDPSDR